MNARPELPVHEAQDYRWVVVLALAAGALAVLPFDVALAKFFMSDPLPGELRSLIHKSEFFGHAYGILGIAFTIYLICEERRRQLLRLVATAFSAGILCDVVKIFFHRIRPVDFSFTDGASTFLGFSFLHVDAVSQVFASCYHSFPSAHTATAVAFALGLRVMFPKGGRWFLSLAAIVAISRFDGGAHYVSDTFVGALLGYFTVWWMDRPAIADRFTEFERGQSIVPPALPALANVLVPSMRRGVSTRLDESLEPAYTSHDWQK